ncbi:hypothetical protein DTL21_15260 [Bremerella cremea]|uniref:Phospholipase/carboxylesterase/thioesterase domain-containing protein n=2 Tax=Pirellulales TaxID=2691354 RepID=A0A2S8FRP3_9BACT|nr:hypothetical protein C5Y83_15245 [Blastopirellula marina]RCS47348.1 hypothetical protein DTL21_15260 [Bremerella cremea]
MVFALRTTNIESSQNVFMKRLDTPAPPTSHSSNLSVQQSKIYEFRIRRDSSQSCPLELFSPVHYEPGYAYPLIVWMHGAMDNESQLRRIMPLTSTRNFVAVGPRGVNRHTQRANGFPAFYWSQDEASIDAASRRVEMAIESATDQFNIHRRRVFLAGYQDGATMALRLALQNPADYAGVISINGPLPTGNAPLRNLGLCEKLPILLMHCHESTYYTESHLCNDIRLGYSAGLRMDVREYLCGDGIMTDMLEDMNGWVMGQVLK